MKFLFLQAISGPSGLDMGIFLIIWLGVIYFLMIRPNRLKAKKHKYMINNLKINDIIITEGGIYGEISKVNTVCDTVLKEEEYYLNYINPFQLLNHPLDTLSESGGMSSYQGKLCIT